MEAFLFKSEPEYISALNEPENINTNVNGLIFKGIDPTSLTKLESILTGVDFFHIYQRGDYRVIYRNDETGAMFINSSKELIESLKTIAEDEKDEIVTQWCSSQEVSLYGWSNTKARELLNWLIRSAGSIKSSREQFILFVDKSKTVKKDPELISQ